MRKSHSSRFKRQLMRILCRPIPLYTVEGRRKPREEGIKPPPEMALVDRKRLPFRRKIRLACPADRADPIGRKFFKRGAGLHAAVRVPRRGVINITADIAYILFHFSSPFGKMNAKM
jgi:hypothetical protein